MENGKANPPLRTPPPLTCPVGYSDGADDMPAGIVGRDEAKNKARDSKESQASEEQRRRSQSQAAKTRMKAKQRKMGNQMRQREGKTHFVIISFCK